MYFNACAGSTYERNHEQVTFSLRILYLARFAHVQILFLFCFRSLFKMAGSENGSMFGMLDFLMFGGMAGVALFWFVFRKKKDEEPASFKTLKTM